MEDVNAGRLLAWSACVAYALLVWFASSLDAPTLPPVGRLPFDKLLHAVEFAVLAWLLVRALATGGAPSGRAAILALVLTITYAVADEIHQRFVPGRTASVADVLADTLGASATVLVLWRIGRRRRRLQRA